MHASAAVAQDKLYAEAFRRLHLAIEFETTHANISVGGNSEVVSFSCQNNAVQLDIAGAQRQTIALTSSDFSAVIPELGEYYFELAGPAKDCFIPHSDVYRAESFATSPFDFWAFCAFQAKVDVQKGSVVETYEVDCDSGELHFHRNL